MLRRMDHRSRPPGRIAAPPMHVARTYLSRVPSHVPVPLGRAHGTHRPSVSGSSPPGHDRPLRLPRQSRRGLGAQCWAGVKAPGRQVSVAARSTARSHFGRWLIPREPFTALGRPGDRGSARNSGRKPRQRPSQIDLELNSRGQAQPRHAELMAALPTFALEAPLSSKDPHGKVPRKRIKSRGYG